jgi:myo-inositol-1(or 4)-monophosphatase
MPLPSPKALLDCAILAARAGGQHAMSNLHRRQEYKETFAHDIKLALDIECQRVAEEAITTTYPDHLFLGEEDLSLGRTDGEQPAPKDAVQWISDPIDGTVNFSHGLPLWCCSVAARIGEEIVAGAVFIPEMDQLYSATIDGPACCNAERIQVSQTASLDRAMVMTGMDKHMDPAIKPYELFSRIADNTQKARIVGSAAVDLCWVAAGGADGYFERGIYIWDIAAAGLIVRRAGGLTTKIESMDEPYRMAWAASTPLIHDALCELVRL